MEPALRVPHADVEPHPYDDGDGPMRRSFLSWTAFSLSFVLLRCSLGLLFASSPPPTWPTAKERLTLRGHTAGLQSLAYSPDGKTLASSSRDGTIKLWDVATGTERATLRGH